MQRPTLHTEQMMTRELTRYEITFGEAGSQNKWTTTYTCENFADAEFSALNLLAANDDRHSYIQKIERW